MLMTLWLHMKYREPVVYEMLQKLKQQYHLGGGSELQWLLRIRVVQDRKEADLAKSIHIYRQDC
jgi:hypothetical protein